MTHYRVLLLEDNPGDARLVREAAVQFGGYTFQLHHVTHLAAAVEALQTGDYDVILSDLALPDSFGLETVQQLQVHAPRCPLVVLTASHDDQQSTEILRLGADDYLVKGELTPASVLRSVRHAIERRQNLDRTAEALHEHARMIDTMQRIGSSLISELELHRIVQLVTDEATTLTRAAFGAFFYNVLNAQGESYTLYTLSGVPREAFSRFPMPRNTHVFAPTFKGEGVVRSDDITADARYGKNPPYNGMPSGHLPVRSYLAVPVISRAGTVMGGLFFGHPEPAQFTERDEQIVVGIAGWAAVAIDNAHLYEAERHARADAEHANRAKSDFLATMSHELRTPLNAMLGYTDLWLMNLPTALPDLMRPQVQRVKRSAQHLLQLIEEILTFSRIEAGQERLDLEPILLKEQLETVATLIEPLALEKLLRFGIEAPEHQLMVITDARKLRQILINLLSNAVKFTDHGGVTLQVEERGGSLYFSVRDTGRGIPQEAQNRIFEPFWQVEDMRQRPEGTGLGLSVTRRLVLLLGGEIHLESELGVGSTFTVCLPMESTVPSKAAAPV